MAKTAFRQRLEEDARKAAEIKQAVSEVKQVLDSMNYFNPNVHKFNHKQYFEWRETLSRAMARFELELSD